MSTSDDVKYRIEFVFGHSESEMRSRREGNREIFEGRRVDYDQDGRLTHVGPWGQLGVLIHPKKPVPWWRFW